MALLNEPQLRTIAKARTTQARDSIGDSLNKTLKESSTHSAFDIFLSHSYLDKELILGITEYLARLGYSVYVDWKQDTQLNRDLVTKQTAEIVRARITQSKCLFFATTEAAKESRWIPWELGYMDGQKSKSAVLPVSRNSDSGEAYKGREYLGVYPYITSSKNTKGDERLWVHEDAETYVVFEKWLKGTAPHKHA